MKEFQPFDLVYLSIPTFEASSIHFRLKAVVVEQGVMGTYIVRPAPWSKWPAALVGLEKKQKLAVLPEWIVGVREEQ